MLLNFFSRLAGLRKPLLNPDNLQDYVEVVSWFHAESLPAQHVALRIVQAGADTHYLSFAPKSLQAPSGRNFWQLRCGVEGYFIACYEDELIVQGFRNAWPAIKAELNPQQLSYIRKDSIKKVSDYEILQIIKEFSKEIIDELKNLGRPTEVVQLRSLDVAAMIKEIESLTVPGRNINWASWSGTCFHETDTYNCAAMVLNVLYAGGLGNLITTSNDVLGEVGLLIGAGYFAFQNSQYWLDAVIDIGIGFVAGRSLGSFYEGYTGIQTYLNVLASRGSDNIFSVLGLRLLSMSLGTLVGTLKPGIVVPAVLAIPRDTLNLAHQAKVQEEAISSYRIQEKPKN